jgi:DNA topoisomerase IB
MVRRVDCNGAGITRRRQGRGFSYRSARGTRIRDRRVLERIRALAIPPAWEDVWICPDPDGHIQATGVDVKGRRQYRYHDGWTKRRARHKHDRILRFAQRLPELRKRVRRDLALDGMPRERVLAAAVRLLELGCFRVGGEPYASTNGSYGLATLRKDHVRVQGRFVCFDFDAKSGQHLARRIVDDDVREVVLALRRRHTSADAELFAYRDGDRWVDVRSDDINGYIQDAIGEDFSSKDFRTWVATVLAAIELAEVDQEDLTSEAARKRVVREVVRDVAQHLGNTAAVARSAYIDPRVVERFEEDDTIADALGTKRLRRLEDEVLDLIARGR